MSTRSSNTNGTRHSQGGSASAPVFFFRPNHAVLRVFRTRSWNAGEVIEIVLRRRDGSLCVIERSHSTGPPKPS